MGDELELLDPVVTRDRLIRNTVWVSLGLVLLAFTWKGPRLGLSVGLGSLLGVVNLKWVSASLRAILEGAAVPGGQVRPAAWKFILRYLLFGAIVLVALQTRWFGIIGIVIGFCGFLGAALLEAIYGFALTRRHLEM